MWPLLSIALVLSAEPRGIIAYVEGDTPDSYCVHVLDLASGDSRPVGPGNADGAPTWSPEGTWMAFDTATDAGRGIYVVRADGTQGRPLDHRQAWNLDPRWSPDGRRLAYTAGEGFTRRLAVYDLDGDTEMLWGADDIPMLRPVWIPDASIVRALAANAPTATGLGASLINAPADNIPGVLALGVVPTDSGITTEIFIVTQDESVRFPGWAMPSKGEGDYVEWRLEPHMKSASLVFESNDGGDREIFVLTMRGPYDVSNHHSADWNPVWSPDGKWIAFESLRSGTRGIYRVYRDTNRVFPVAVSDDADHWAPAWSRDGKWIAYVSDRYGNPDIFIASVNGGEPRRVTSNAADEFAPAWRP